MPSARPRVAVLRVLPAVDARAHDQLDRHWSSALGVDNLNNRKYFLYHPFPERTFYAELRYDL
ncbi:MAG TPA: hypothetical protein VGG24_07110 [Paraburkholderia sp.]|jgi:iron complex outermembrane receptor protein